jgi:hypothetical protein
MHPYGSIYNTVKNWTWELPLPGLFYAYYVADFKQDKGTLKDREFMNDGKHFHKSKSNGKIKTHRIGASLGLGDFNDFNLMILYILQVQWSFLTRLLVVLGCIISIQVGYCGTLYMEKLWSIDISPALPFPVVIFSIYAIIVDVII